LSEATATSLPEYRTACGGTIKDQTIYPSVDYHGGIIYFCTHACLRVFKEDPDAFMTGEVEHPTGED